MLGFQVSRYGLWFPWQGDEVCYVWPWCRTPPRRSRWVSLLCEGGFSSMRAMRGFWMSYEIAERRAMRRERAMIIQETTT